MGRWGSDTLQMGSTVSPRLPFFCICKSAYELIIGRAKAKCSSLFRDGVERAYPDTASGLDPALRFVSIKREEVHPPLHDVAFFD